MRRSTDRILTTHVGSLPNLVPLDESEPDFATKLPGAVRDVVAKQREIGVDLINEGEYTKGGDWLSFVESRFGGFSEGERPAGELPLIMRGKDREQFAGFYEYATERATLFFEPGQQIRRRRPYWVCTGPVTYTGQDELAREIALLKDAAGTEDTFLTSTAPLSLEVYRRNDFYKSEEEYVFAIADAIHVEYKAIVDAGFLLQVDDAWLPALWDRIGLEMGLEAFRKRSMLRIEALNHALEGIPEDRVRYHLCWGSWHGPARLRHRAAADRRPDAGSAGAGLPDRGRQRAARARMGGVAGRQAAGGQDPDPRRRHALDRRGRAPGARFAAHPALRRAGRPRERHRGHGLRFRRPFAPADRLGEARLAGRRRSPGVAGAVEVGLA